MANGFSVHVEIAKKISYILPGGLDKSPNVFPLSSKIRPSYLRPNHNSGARQQNIAFRVAISDIFLLPACLVTACLAHHALFSFVFPLSYSSLAYSSVYLFPLQPPLHSRARRFFRCRVSRRASSRLATEETVKGQGKIVCDL